MKKRITAAAGIASAAIVLAVLMLFLGGTGAAQGIHTCSPTDRQFIQVAQLNMLSFSSTAEDFLHGSGRASSVIATTETSRSNVEATHPEDPSLRKARAVLAGMFAEYARAVRAKMQQEDPGQHIYSAYSFANLAHGILARAQAPLKQRGCDIAPLL